MKGVDGGDEHERIEIELTANDPRSRSTPVTSQPARDGGDRWPGSPRGRIAALVGAVGLGALALGWMLGSALGDDTAADTPATTDDGSNDDEHRAEESDEVVETLPPAEISTTTTERPRPTPTTLPPVATSTVEVAPQLVDRPYELVGLASSNHVIVLDLASGTLTERSLVLRDTSGSGRLRAGTGWIVIPDCCDPTGQSRSWLVEDGTEPIEVDLGPDWNLMESDTPDHFWRTDGISMPGRRDHAELVDRYGEPVGESIELPPITQGGRYADPAGGIVVAQPGGTFSVTPDGASRILDGAVLAIGVEWALGIRCDDRLECEHVVVDRTTGDTRAIALAEELPRSPMFFFGKQGDLGTIGPDGKTAAVGWYDETGPKVVLIDLDTAAVTRLAVLGDPIVRWTPDGRYAIYLDAGRAKAHDLASRESFVVAHDLPRLVDIAGLVDIAVRPSSERTS